MLLRIGVTTAVKVAAAMKKIKSPINIHAIPLIFLARLAICRPAPGTMGPPDMPYVVANGCCDEEVLLSARFTGRPFSKRIVSVYSAGPSPNRKPQLRQNLRSRGMGVRQFEQIVTLWSISDCVGIP